MIKKTALAILLILAITLSIGIVAADENVTSNTAMLSQEDNDNIAVENNENSQINTDNQESSLTDTSEDDDKMEIEIIVKSTNTVHQNDKLTVKFKEKNVPKDDPYAFVDVIKYKFEGKSTKTLTDYTFTTDGPIYKIPCNLEKGTYKLTVSIEDSAYKIDPVTITVKITNMNPKVYAKKIVTSDKYLVLKATVTNNGKNVNEGKIKFTIHGKTYTVKVKKGVATKKIKIKNGYYYYKATFTAPKYATKSSSNYAIKGNKYYTFKAKGVYDSKTYTIKIPLKKYLKLVEAKRDGYYDTINVKTGKKAKFLKTIDIYKTKTVYKWKKIKVLDYEEFWDYGTTYSYDTYKYYKAGWTYVGGSSKTFSDGYEHYSIFKKKVKTTEKVYVGYKNVLSSKSYTLRFSAGVNENSKLYCRWDIPRESQLKANLVIPHWSGRL